MQRDHRQRRRFQIVVCPAYQVSGDDHPVVMIVGVKGGVQNSAVGEAAVKDDGFHPHVA